MSLIMVTGSRLATLGGEIQTIESDGGGRGMSSDEV